MLLRTVPAGGRAAGPDPGRIGQALRHRGTRDMTERGVTTDPLRIDMLAADSRRGAIRYGLFDLLTSGAPHGPA